MQGKHGLAMLDFHVGHLSQASDAGELGGVLQFGEQAGWAFDQAFQRPFSLGRGEKHGKLQDDASQFEVTSWFTL